MFGQEQAYLFADPVFYEDVSRWDDVMTRFEVTKRPAPDGWDRIERDPWVVLRPTGHTLPKQGWKIHVSARMENASHLCEEVWEYCVGAGVSFKFLRSSNVLLAHSAKYAPRASSSKLLTIYPQDTEQFHEILRILGERLAGEQSPYILSDLRWGDGPLYVRYGGFVERPFVDEQGQLQHAIERPDGSLVPDRRRPVFAVPDWVTLPDFLAPHLAARRDGGGTELPYRVEKALHFSNGGGVYLARRLTDDAQVVLKEARPFAGLDENHDDAVTRLRREHWALERLAGVDGVPQSFGLFQAGGHEFLAEEYIEGQTLQVWQGCEHPLVVNDDPTDRELAEYTLRAMELHAKIAALVARLHERGVVFADLHPANVIVRPDGSVALIDFELAHESTEDRAPGLGAIGFAGGARRGVERDRYALAAVALWLFVPLNRVLVLDPTRIDTYLDFMIGRFPVPADFVEAPRRELGSSRATSPASNGVPLVVSFGDATPDWATLQRAMVAAILTSATPERTDRLFPGDIRQFTHDALGLAHGAAGVLWTLSVTGGGRYPDHEQWLLDALETTPPRRAGLYDGAHGMAYALDHLGHRDRAIELLDRAVALGTPTRAVDLYSGMAGAVLNLLWFADQLGDRRYGDEAFGIGKRLAEALEMSQSAGEGSPAGGPASVAPGQAGLMRGWSGVALSFLRLYEATGDIGWLDLCTRALHRDLDQCVPSVGGSLQVEEPGVRTLSYLERGSAGIALVADELLVHRADARLATAMPSLVRACSSEFVLQANLFQGRAGLLAATARAGAYLPDGARTTVERHLRRLAWHAVSFRGHLAFPGHQSLRLSMDLASGTAGVLLAVQAATTGGGQFLPFFDPARSASRAGRLVPPGGIDGPEPH